MSRDELMGALAAHDDQEHGYLQFSAIRQILLNNNDPQGKPLLLEQHVNVILSDLNSMRVVDGRGNKLEAIRYDDFVEYLLRKEGITPFPSDFAEVQKQMSILGKEDSCVRGQISKE